MAVSENSEQEEGEIAESPAGPGLGFRSEDGANLVGRNDLEVPGASVPRNQPAPQTVALRVPSVGKGRFLWALRKGAAAEVLPYPPIPNSALLYSHPSNLAWARACLPEEESKSEYSTASEGSAWRDDVYPLRNDWTEDLSPSNKIRGEDPAPARNEQSPSRSFSRSQSGEVFEESGRERTGLPAEVAVDSGEKEEGELEEGEIADDDLDGNVDAAGEHERAPETAPGVSAKNVEEEVVSDPHERGAIKSRLGTPRGRARSPRGRELSRSPRRRGLSRSPRHDHERRYRTRSRSREGDRRRRRRSRSQERRDRRGHSPTRGGESRQHGRSSRDRSASRGQDRRKRRGDSVDSVGAIVKEFWDRVGKVKQEDGDRRSPRSERGSPKERGAGAEQARLLGAAEALAGKVSVQQAMKSLASVCQTLEDAVWKLCKAIRTNGGAPREVVLKIADNVFFGIRTAYIIGTTGAGRNQGKDDAVLSLIKLAHKDMSRLFSPKQFKEVESWLEHLTSKVSKSPPSGLAGKPKDPTFAATQQGTPALTSSQAPASAPSLTGKPAPTSSSASEPTSAKPSGEPMPSVKDLADSAEPLSKDLDALRRDAQAYAQGKLRGASHLPETEQVPETRATASLPVDPLEPPGFAQPFTAPFGPPGFNVYSSTEACQPQVQPGLPLEVVEEAFSDDESQPIAASSAAPSRGLDLPPGFRLFEQPPQGLHAAPLGAPWGSEAALPQRAPSLQKRPVTDAAGGQLPGSKPAPLDDDDDLPEEILEPPGFAPPALPATVTGASKNPIEKARALHAVAASDAGLLSERPSTAASGNQRGLSGQDEIGTQEKPPGFDGAAREKEGLRLAVERALSPCEAEGTEKAALVQVKEEVSGRQSSDGAGLLGKRPRSSLEDTEATQRGAKRSSGDGGAKTKQPELQATVATRSEVQKKLDEELLRRLKVVRETQSQGGVARRETVGKDGQSEPGKRPEGQNRKGISSGESLPEEERQSRGEVVVLEKSVHATGQEARRPPREQGSREKREDEKQGLSETWRGSKGAKETRELADKGGEKGDAKGSAKMKDTDGERSWGTRALVGDGQRNQRGDERRGPADRERRREKEARREPLESPRRRSGQGSLGSPRGGVRSGTRIDSRREESRTEQRRREDTRREDVRKEDSRRGSGGRGDDREKLSSPRKGVAHRRQATGDETKERGARKERSGGEEDQGRPKSGSQEARSMPEKGRSSAAVELTSRRVAEQVTSSGKEQRIGPPVAKASQSGTSTDLGRGPSPPLPSVVQKRDGEAQPPGQPEVSATSNGAPVRGPSEALLLPAVAAVSVKTRPGQSEGMTVSRAPSPAGSRSQSPAPTRAASPALSDSRVVTARKPMLQGGRTEPSNLGRPPRAPPTRENAQPLREAENGERGSRAGESVQESGQSRNSAQALSTADSVESAMLGVLLSGADSEGERSRDGLERQGSGQLATRPSGRAGLESNTGPGPKGLVSNGVGKLRGILKKSNSAVRVPSDAQLGGSQSAVSGDPHVDALLSGLGEKERAAVELERERRLGEQERMLAAKKLCLVLDLDHTLLNSATFLDIATAGPGWAKKLEAKLAGEDAACRACPPRHRELHMFPDMQLWTKLRPGVATFLKKASQLYELHVYTMGNSVYATRMAQILDPTGEYFAGRIISKGDALEDPQSAPGDSPAPLRSKDLDGVLGMESCVLIIDDNVKVWPHHFHNLIVVERYLYFPGSRQQFGQKGPALFEQAHDERAHDGMLASASRVMEQVHGDFFRALQEHNDAARVDARDILQKIQKSILQGVRIVFSRVFPQGTAHPQQNSKWRMAEQFGATCTLTLDDSVTHVVAVALGTDKVHWALKNNRHVVNPHWLEASAVLYKRANESDFPVMPSMQQG